MNMGDLCNRDVYVVEPDEPLAVAAREMCNRHVGMLVVVRKRNDSVVPVGIVTDRDIVCRQLARGADLFCLSVGDVMTPDPLCLDEDCGLAEAIRHLGARGVRRAPVINTAGELVGVVAFDDILPELAGELGGLARLIGNQARYERPAAI